MLNDLFSWKRYLSYSLESYGLYHSEKYCTASEILTHKKRTKMKSRIHGFISKTYMYK